MPTGSQVYCSQAVNFFLFNDGYMYKKKYGHSSHIVGYGATYIVLKQSTLVKSHNRHSCTYAILSMQLFHGN